VLSIGDLNFLYDYAHHLRNDYETLRFEQPETVIHGDATTATP
jgi:hypothetical protein